MIHDKIHLIRPGCLKPSIALTVQNRGNISLHLFSNRVHLQVLHAVYLNSTYTVHKMCVFIMYSTYISKVCNMRHKYLFALPWPFVIFIVICATMYVLRFSTNTLCWIAEWNVITCYLHVNNYGSENPN